MARPELGTKRTDPETGRKFFDLNKDPIVSPYTGKSYPLSFFESGISRSGVEEDEEAETETVEIEETPNTVSLSEVEDDEEAGAKDDLPDVDGDEDDDDTAADDTFLEEDEDDDDDVTDIIGGGRDDDDDV